MNDTERRHLGDQARKIEYVGGRLIELAFAFDTLHMHGPYALLCELKDDLDSAISSIRFLINQPPKGTHEPT